MLKIVDLVTLQGVSCVVDLSSSLGMIGRRRTEDDCGDNPRLALQRFVYDDDGFIACRADSSLVLGLHEQDSGPAAAICLVRRRDEDVYQRWIIHDNGYRPAYFFFSVLLIYHRKIYFSFSVVCRCSLR